MEISVIDAKAKIDRGDPVHLIDVREHEEIAICRIEGAEHIPMMELFTGTKRTTAARDAEIVVYCHTGIRSMEAARYLTHHGFSNVASLAGGIHAWAGQIDSTLATY